MTLVTRLSIKAKLRLAILGTSALSIALVFAGLFAYDRITSTDLLVSDLSAKAGIVAENINTAISLRDSLDALRVLRSLASQPHILAAAAYDGRGGLLASYVRHDWNGSFPLTPTSQSWWFEENALHLYQPVMLNDARVGTMYLSMDLLGRDDRYRSYLPIGLLVLLGTLGMAYLFALLFERTIARPTIVRAETAHRISPQEDYSLRASKTATGETDLRIDAFHHTLLRLLESVDTLEQTTGVRKEDLGTRRPSENALSAAEAQLRLVTETTPLMLAQCSRDLRFVFVNRAYATMLGLTPEDIEGRHIREIVGEDGFSSILPRIEMVLTGVRVEYEADISFRGDKRLYTVQYIPEKDVEGRTVGWFALIMDATSRKRAESALRESEERSHLARTRLAAIVESSSDAIISMDLDGTVMSWNAGAERILGYKAEEIIGRPIYDLVPQDIHIEEDNILERLRQGERIEPFDTVRIKKGGEHVHLSLTISPLKDSGGTIVGSSKIGRDITERKRSVDALRQSEGRFRHLILSLPVALYTTDIEGRITLFNEPAAHMWGSRPVTGEDSWCASWRIYRPDGTPLKHEDSSMAVALRENRPIRGEEIIVERPDGSRVYVLPHAEPLHDVAGRLTGAINVLVDITDRKRAEEALREAHDDLEERVRNRTMDLVAVNDELQKRDLQLTTAQQIAHLGSWEWDLQTSLVTWSEELYHIFGLGKNDFDHTLRSFLERLHPDDRNTTLRNVQEALRTHQPFDFEERLIRPDGTIRFLHTQGRVVKDEQGQVARLLGVCLDVTDRKRADKRFRDLLETAPNAVVIVNNEGRIIIVNAQTELLFGYQRTELLGQQLEMLLPERFHRTHEGHRANYFLKPHSRSMGQGLELFGLRKDKSEFPVEISLSPIETEEGTLVTSSIRDVTQQKRMQEELLASERTRFSELRRFARSAQHAQEEERLRIARELHDGICQTLSGMKLKAESMEEEVGQIDEAFSRKLQAFNSQYEVVIDEVRRISTNLRPPALDDFGLGVAMSLLTHEFKKTQGVTATLVVDESIKLDLQTEIALYRITQESLANITKHADATCVSIVLQRSEGKIMLRINDNGKGFDPANVSVRKDPFHGFGLVAMRDRTDILGGTFTLESACGQGTTITITIPENGKEGG